jgi:protocatechuate 3,4-dioxygenase, alpha subunit
MTVPLIPTASQTVGPFVEIGCKYLATDRLGANGPSAIDAIVRGRVIDGDGAIVPDFMLEIWQTTPALGFARVMPLTDGSFAFHASSVSHLAILVFMRGLLKPVLTRMYFPNDPRNVTDPALALVPANRRATLIATAESDAPLLELEWNVVLQGEAETVFFEW